MVHLTRLVLEQVFGYVSVGRQHKEVVVVKWCGGLNPRYILTMVGTCASLLVVTVFLLALLPAIEERRPILTPAEKVKD